MKQISRNIGGCFRKRFEKLEILSGEDVTGVGVVGFENLTAHLIAVLSTPGF